MGHLVNYQFIFLLLFLSKRPLVSESEEITLNARVPWPGKLELPTVFRPDLANALQTGQSLSTKLRRQLINRLFDHFSRFTL